MTESQDGVLNGNPKPTSMETAPDQTFGLAGPDGGSGGQLRMDNDADLGGHTLLSRSPAFQGRRSLFRH